MVGYNRRAGPDHKRQCSPDKVVAVHTRFAIVEKVVASLSMVGQRKVAGTEFEEAVAGRFEDSLVDKAAHRAVDSLLDTVVESKPLDFVAAGRHLDIVAVGTVPAGRIVGLDR